IEVRSWVELTAMGYSLLKAAWASLKALEFIRRKLFPIIAPVGKGEHWRRFDDVLELNNWIGQEGFDKELRGRIKKDANIVQVTGTLFQWAPIFTGRWINIEQEWLTILKHLKSKKEPKALSEAIREWYTISLRQWGFSGLPREPAINGSQYLGFATSDEIDAIPVRVSGDIWRQFRELVFGERELVADVTLRAKIERSDLKHEPFILGRYIVSQPAAHYELRIDNLNQVVEREATRFFSAYVWQLVDAGQGNGYAVWEHCNVANYDLFEHYKDRLNKRVQEILGPAERLGHNSYSISI
ncbi:MAG: hypothetical protein ACE5I2_15245, partial [Anaerolineae bacterium]